MSPRDDSVPAPPGPWDIVAPNGPRLSRTALHLHVRAVLAGIDAGHAGLVQDDDLRTLGADGADEPAQLIAAGLWTPVSGGYRVSRKETLRVARACYRRLLELSAECRTSGGHLPDPAHPEVCGRCFTHLKLRPHEVPADARSGDR